MSELERITCGECGIEFAAPTKWLESRREDKATFYCPNGHARAYRKSTADKLAEELSRAKQQLAYQEDRNKRLWDEKSAAERKAAAARGQVTKLKKRASGGVCPCCNRTFLALQKHMAQKHPGFVAEPVDGDNVVPLRAIAGA